MPNLKRPMIRLLAVILSAVLGGLLIFGEPASAATIQVGKTSPCSEVGTVEKSCTLEPNTGYKIKLEKAEPKERDSVADCYSKIIYATFEFTDPDHNQDNNLFPDGKFTETYPIQDNWELHFNTPLYKEGQTGTLKIEPDDQCNLVVAVSSGQTLQLFSGFKTEDELQENQAPSGHFVVAKDYYAVTGENQEDCTGDEGKEDNYYDSAQGQCYERLGSLTGITGNNFPALGGAVVAQIIIKPNSIRAPHWHLQFAEAGYCYQGMGQVGVIVPSNTIPKSASSPEFYKEKIVEEIFLKENEVFLFPEGSQHYLRNIGTEDFKCTLFFAEGPPLNGDQLLTITLQNIVGNTPMGVLNPVFVAEGEDENSTINKISNSPAQSFSSPAQGPNVIPVVEACSGEDPDIKNPGCPPKYEPRKLFKFGFSPYSEFEP